MKNCKIQQVFNNIKSKCKNKSKIRFDEIENRDRLRL